MPRSSNTSQTLAALLGSALLLALTAGCISRPAGEATRLLQHPEFKYAAQAAPAFTADCLDTIARLEARR